MNIVAILAAGNGTRMNINIPKQFALIKGQTVLDYSVTAFCENENVDKIIIVTSEKYIGELKQKFLNIPKIFDIIAGGEQRFMSAHNAVKYCVDNLSNDANNINLWIHDAARPFISQNMINRIAGAVKTHPVVSVGVISSDTVYLCDEDSNIIDIPNRKNVFMAQTPQVARLSIYKEAFDNIKKGMAITDDISVIFNTLDVNIFLMEGEHTNKKITYSEDLPI